MKMFMILCCGLSTTLLMPQEESTDSALEDHEDSSSAEKSQEKVDARQSWERKLSLFELTGEQVFVLDTNFQDEPGSVSAQATQVSLRKSFRISGSSFIGFNVRYQFTHFDFSNFVLQGRTVDPFEKVHSTTVGLQYRQEFTDKFSTFLLAAGSSEMEEGADFSESLKPRVFAMGLYEWFDRLTTGIGVGMLYDLDDEVIAFPVVSVEWKISDRFDLRVRNDVKFSYLLLPENNLKVSFVGGFSRQFGAQTFRLSESGAAPGGTAEFRGFSMGLQFEWEPLENFLLGAYAGILPYYELRIEDRRNSRVFRDRLNPAVQLGLSLSLSL